MPLSRRSFLINTATAAAGTLLLPKVSKIIAATPEDMERLSLEKEMHLLSNQGLMVRFVTVSDDAVAGYQVDASVIFATKREAYNLARFIDPSRKELWPLDETERHTL